MTSIATPLEPHTTEPTAENDPDAAHSEDGLDTAAIDVDAPEPVVDADGWSPVAVSAVPAAVAVLRDPRQLVIAENVRKSFDLADHTELAESITEHGVLAPIIAIGLPDEPTAVVRDGQLRTLTAVAVGVEQVPVWLIDPAAVASGKQAEIDRILEQITVNDRRVGLTEGDRAAGIALALDLGASVTRVSKALQTPRDRVKLAGKVGASATARKAVDEGQYDFEQAAVIAEYEIVGDTDAVTRLQAAATRFNFSYVAHQIANDRDERRAYFAAAMAWAEAGFGILDEQPRLHDDDLIASGDLVDADGNPVDEDRIWAEPGAWLVWIEPADDQLFIERDTGAVIDPDAVDWDTDRDPNLEPADGLRHAREIDVREGWVPEYFLPASQLDALGLRRRLDDIEVHGADNPGAAEDADVAEELATRRAEAAAEAERQRQRDREAARRVRELNKQGVAAMQARREFVTTPLARKTPPPVAAKFIAEALVDDTNLLGEYNAFETAAELLAGTGTWRRDLLHSVETAKPARCQVIVLGLVLGAYEKRATKDSWRHNDRGVARYLKFLREVGHQLVPVELAAAGELDPDTIDIDTPITADPVEQAAAA
ncbi:chromosome partitioning protein ParB [Nocardia cyriacigeorgica]|uniref:ParB/Srx family N-terminal domain-containing protein n=1 Tax=Nocardia cyriacigeorgica TaxID=135487 RepID=UPI0018963D90|nr:ParB/Srx family N-terminal domain-containing protein [Nocardia cyriacigeorgica]MBF6320301.1 chromosome partitioning protein ParB [Nocardia cyriacigeorgica]MBF6346323.1 chromosome partitioning protein ParB [Nocardia cyriacigeorgica]MBF6534213.1 chromosome partitioning protein ParB [Nocardia cyriacigeorgica]